MITTKDDNQKKKVKRISAGDIIVYVFVFPIGLIISLTGIYIFKQGPIIGSIILTLFGGFIICMIIVDIYKKITIAKRDDKKS